MLRHRLLSLVATLGLCLAASGAEVVVSDVTSRAVPIHLEGFSGEAKSVLEFDLYVAGFDLVGPSQAQYALAGKAGTALAGVLSDVNNKANLFNRTYPGGSVRAQAHALADDVVQAVTGRKGISRTKLVFKVQKERVSEVYASDFDGANPVQLTTDANIVAAPAWRPGRKSIVYTSYRAGNADIYSQDLTTGQRKVLVRFSGSNISPAPSPDGSKLAMILSRAGSPDLWVGDAGGQPPQADHHGGGRILALLVPGRRHALRRLPGKRVPPVVHDPGRRRDDAEAHDGGCAQHDRARLVAGWQMDRLHPLPGGFLRHLRRPGRWRGRQGDHRG